MDLRSQYACEISAVSRVNSVMYVAERNYMHSSVVGYGHDTTHGVKLIMLGFGETSHDSRR